MAKHYISIDSNNRIIKGFSEVFEMPQETDICINENGGRHFELLGIINPPLTNDQGVFIYKYEDKQVLRRTEDEIHQEYTSIAIVPSQIDSVMLAIAELDNQRQQDKLETQLAIAELANSLLGGV